MSISRADGCVRALTSMLLVLISELWLAAGLWFCPQISVPASSAHAFQRCLCVGHDTFASFHGFAATRVQQHVSWLNVVPGSVHADKRMSSDFYFWGQAWGHGGMMAAIDMRQPQPTYSVLAHREDNSIPDHNCTPAMPGCSHPRAASRRQLGTGPGLTSSAVALSLPPSRCVVLAHGSMRRRGYGRCTPEV